MSVSSVSAQNAQATTAGSNTAAQASLNRLVQRYSAEVKANDGTAQLATLAKQIQTAAKAIGTHVTLPQAQAPAAPAASPAAAPASAQNAGRLDVRA